MHQMSTASLQRAFPQIYEQFYREHDLVISLPFQFRRAHDMPSAENSLLIKQQLPTKIYLWVTLQRRPGVFFWSCSSYSFHKWFEHETVHEVLWSERVGQLETYISKLLAWESYKRWITIDILSEQRKWYGFAFMWLFWTLLASLVYLVTNKISLNDLKDYNKFMSLPIWNQLVKLAIDIDVSTGGLPSWFTQYNALCNKGEPVVQFGSKSFLTLDSAKNCTDVSCKVASLSDLIWKKISDCSMPIDYWIITFGVEYDERETFRRGRYFDQAYNDTMDYYKKIKTKLKLPSTLDMPETLPVRCTSTYLKISLLKNRDEMFARPSEPHFVDAFIQSIADLGTHAVLFEKQKQQLLDLYAQFHYTKRFYNENIAFAPMSLLKAWGSILFVCHKAQSRQTVERMMQWLQKLGYEDAHFSYQSRRDGWCDDGLIVEQRLSKHQYSWYVPKGSAIVQAGNWTSKVVDRDEVSKANLPGIVLDQIHGKVHLSGEKLTHKDMPSQPWTAEIIWMLLEHKWKYLHNSLFSCSSYSKNKNEMVGKIIYPISRLVKKRFGKELEIECDGTVFDFSVRLKNDSGLLYLIKELGK